LSKTIAIAPVRKSLVVNVGIQRAFDVFTAGVDRWWPKTHGIGATSILRSVIEPRVGGRWYTTHEDGRDVVIGHIREWTPPTRFVLGWEISADWKPDSRIELASEVEVRFSAEAADRTRIDLEHRDFERMGAESGEKMRNSVDNGWPGILDLYSKEANRGGSSS
jgi:uncharacterized protein YndB with AHSA1/START domain